LDARPVHGDERELDGYEEGRREYEQDDGEQLRGSGDRSNLPLSGSFREPAARVGGRPRLVTPLQAVLGAVVMAAGAFLQGAVGFGAALVAAPLLALVLEDFVPGPVIVASVLLNVLVMRREGTGSVDRRIHAAIAGQIPGAVLAGVVLASVPESGLSILFAALVLAAVGLSVVGWRLHPTAPTLVGAGFASGFMGTISGIGGPPIALVYQGADGPTLRGTLSRYFLAAAAVSIPTLLIVGTFDGDSIGPALALLPGTVFGFALSGHLARRIDKGHVRPVVLWLSALTALAVLLRELR